MSEYLCQWPDIPAISRVTGVAYTIINWVSPGVGELLPEAPLEKHLEIHGYINYG